MAGGVLFVSVEGFWAGMVRALPWLGVGTGVLFTIVRMTRTEVAAELLVVDVLNWSENWGRVPTVSGMSLHKLHLTILPSCRQRVQI